MTSIRSMANDYFDLTGESAYMGLSQGMHHFVDGTVRSDDAAREHMERLLTTALRHTPVGHHWTHPMQSGHVLLIDPAGKTVRTVPATEHPWRPTN